MSPAEKVALIGFLITTANLGILGLNLKLYTEWFKAREIGARKRLHPQPAARGAGATTRPSRGVVAEDDRPAARADHARSVGDRAAGGDPMTDPPAPDAEASQQCGPAMSRWLHVIGINSGVDDDEPFPITLRMEDWHAIVDEIATLRERLAALPGLGWRRDEPSEPYYVVSVDAATGAMTVSPTITPRSEPTDDEITEAARVTGCIEGRRGSRRNCVSGYAGHGKPWPCLAGPVAAWGREQRERGRGEVRP